MARPCALGGRGLTGPEASDTLGVSQPESKPELALVNLASRVCGSSLSRTAQKCAKYTCVQGAECVKLPSSNRFFTRLIGHPVAGVPELHRPLITFQNFSGWPSYALGRPAFVFEFLR